VPSAHDTSRARGASDRIPALRPSKMSSRPRFGALRWSSSAGKSSC